MIQKLRKRFIIIAMMSTTFVLIAIVGTINIINYRNVKHRIDMEMNMILENDGIFPRGYGPGDRPRPDQGQLSKESPYDTRYFSAVVDKSGNVTTIDTENIFFLNETEAANYASLMYEKGKKTGRYGEFAFATKESEQGTIYVFLYCEMEYATFYNFLLTSGGISLGGLLLVFFLLLYFSKVILRPVEESYIKQRRFITDASHELKTPLTVIDANVEVIEMTNGESEWTSSIHKQTKRLAKLTENLVILSRMEEGQDKTVYSNFDLSQVVMDIAENYHSVAVTKGFDLEILVQEGVSYKGNEQQIGQMLGILLDNAIKYTSGENKIQVKLNMCGGHPQMEVWNTLDDIEKGKHDDLFERFYRMDSSRNKKTGGFGIGLSVAKAIATQHRGSIHAKSTDGKSITFTVNL